MENFCYWHEDVPYSNFNLINNELKICLLRQSEYRIEKESGLIESGLVKGTSIFCPYKTAEQAEECMEYKVSNGKISQ